MENQEQFKTMLNDVRLLAEINGRKIHKEVVEDYFSEMKLGKEQLQHIFAYLEAQAIVVQTDSAVKKESRKASSVKDFNEEDHQAYLAHRRQLKLIVPVTKEEEKKLFEQAAAGDAMAKSRLLEVHLKTVLKLAKPFINRGIPYDDLVQEGNIALMTALETLSDKAEELTWTQYLTAEVTRNLLDLIREQEDMKKFTSQFLSQLDKLNEARNAFAAEQAAAPTPEELSKYLDMALEEIEALLSLID